MGGTRGTSLTLDAMAILRTASYERTPDALGNPTLADPNNMSEEAQRYRAANTGKATLTNLLAVPYLGAVTDLGLKTPFRFGYAGYIPFGGIAQWDTRKDAIASDPLAPGAQDGPQRWHNINGKALSIYNTLAVSYTVEPIRLSFGANFSVAFHDVDTIRARNIPDNSDLLQGFDGRIVEGRTVLNAKGLNVGAAFGVYWEPDEQRKVKLGLSYTSQPNFGQMRLDGELTAQAGSNPEANPPQKVQFLQTYPDIIRLGAAWRMHPQWELRADGEYVRWSVFQNQCAVAPGANCDVAEDGSGDGLSIILNVPRKFRDAVGVRAGAGYFVDEKLELFGSGAVTTSAVPANLIDATVIDSTRLYGTLGARYEFSQSFALGSSLNVIYFFPVDTKGTARTDLLQNPSKGPSGNGIYNSVIGMFNLNAIYTF
jgi:long-chain fatty acid transport protein